MTNKSKNPPHWLKQAARDFYPHIRADRWRLVFLFACNLVLTAGNALLIWMMGTAITQIAGGQFDAVYGTLLNIGGIVLFNQAVRLASSYVYQVMTLDFVGRVRSQMLADVMRISFPLLAKFRKGDVLTRISNDVDNLLTLTVGLPLQVVTNAVVLLVYGSILLWIDWRLTLIAASVTPILFLSQRFVAPRTGAVAREFTNERARLFADEEQVLSNLRGISAFNGEPVVRAQHRRQFDIARDWGLRLRRIRVSYNTFVVVLVYCTGVVVVFSGIESIRSGAMPLGTLASFLMYVRFAMQPIRAIARIPTQLETTRVATERVQEIMHTLPQTSDPTASIPLPAQAGRVEFDRVSFTYPNAARPVFENLSLVVERGESVALAGPSGAGKSTLAALLLRFYDPQHGAIRIDGIDIKSVSLATLRDHISIVWQSPYVFDGTIRDNLLLARPTATEDQMLAACRNGHAWEFIEKLSEGLDTRVGANGVNLSVGQIQRLAIAQAFLRDSPIMILDEASSALDSLSEQLVADALARLRHNRTTLTIAHRFSTTRNAHRVIYFNGDGSTTAGTHEELMKGHAPYRNAVDWQTAHPSPDQNKRPS